MYAHELFQLQTETQVIAITCYREWPWDLKPSLFHFEVQLFPPIPCQLPLMAKLISRGKKGLP